jgi:hypothetical protein
LLWFTVGKVTKYFKCGQRPAVIFIALYNYFVNGGPILACRRQPSPPCRGGGLLTRTSIWCNIAFVSATLSGRHENLQWM